jgi:hypothetical protein
MSLNDHLTPHYARKWLRQNPDAPRFFELRASAADAPASRQMDLGL